MTTRRAGRPAPLILLRSLAALVGAALFAAAPLPAAQAQDAPTRPDRSGAADTTGIQMFLNVGWAGRIIADTWTPFTITLQGAPGIEPMQGSVIIEYAQDATQTASITVPVMAMPDRTTEFVGAVCLPQRCGTVTCRLIDGATGRVLRHAVLSRTPTSTQLELPEIEAPGQPVVASVGAGGGPASTVATLDDAVNLRIRTSAPSRAVPASRLPLSWAPYSGLTVLAVEADAARDIDPRAMSAIREWVAGGGHLVVIAATPGAEWRSWLPPSALGDVVTLDEPATIPPPGDLVEALGVATESTNSNLSRFPAATGRSGRLPAGVHGPPRPRERTGNILDPDDDDASADEPEVSPEADADTPRAQTLTPAKSLPARTLRITRAGEAFGWRIRWRADAAPPGVAWVPAPGDDTGRGAAGLLAEGPVGFGRVTIVGIDPRAAGFPGDLTARKLWTDIAREALNAHTRRAQLSGVDYYNRYGLPSTRASEARRFIMDGLAGIPGGGGAFTVIVIAMLALALLLGPGDALLLGRLRLRHRSWLTALCWISLATAAAYTAPVIGRSSAIAVGRISVVDTFQPAGAAAPGAALAWQTSITAVFSDRTMTASILPHPRPAPDEARSGSPASWWRGISASDFDGDFQPLAVFPAVQAAPELTSERAQRDPWGGRGVPRPPTTQTADTQPVTPVATPGACTPMPTLFRTWTFRSFQDEARVPPPCIARVERSAGGLRVRIPPLPAGAAISHAACRTREGWHTLSFHPAEGGGFEATSDAAPTSTPAPWREWLPGFLSPHVNERTIITNVLEAPSMALALTPHVHREDAIEQLLRYGRGLPSPSAAPDPAGGWAVVHLLLTNMPADAALSGREPEPRTVVCRITTPIEPAAGETAP